MNELEKIDSNFKMISASETKDGKDFYSLPNEKFDLYGVYYDDTDQRFRRLPQEVADSVNIGVAWESKQTSGGRIRFSTDSTLFELYASYDCFEPHNHMPLSGSAGFVLLEERDEGNYHVQTMRPGVNDKEKFSSSVGLVGGKMRNYILHLPNYGRVNELTIALKEGAKVQGGKKYRDIKPILYYGSSITQGGCASRSDNAYQAHVSKWNNIDFINLGFSGSARAEDNMVDYLTTIDCSLFVCDYDHNAPDVEYLRNTHYRLYERYRAVRPDTPILFVTKPDFDYDPTGKERENIIRNTYKKAKANGDKNVYFLAGRTFYGKKDRENFAVDRCHPNDLGFYYMAKGIYKKIKEIDEIFR